MGSELAGPADTPQAETDVSVLQEPDLEATQPILPLKSDISQVYEHMDSPSPIPCAQQLPRASDNEEEGPTQWYSRLESEVPLPAKLLFTDLSKGLSKKPKSDPSSGLDDDDEGNKLPN